MAVSLIELGMASEDAVELIRKYVAEYCNVFHSWCTIVECVFLDVLGIDVRANFRMLLDEGQKVH